MNTENTDPEVIVNGNCLMIRKDISTVQLKSSSFNRTIILDENTKETVSRLIKEKFFSITEGEWWRDSERNELIKTALNLGLTELADEMTLFT